MRNPWPESDPAVMAPVNEHEELREVVRALLRKHANHEQVRAAADSELGYAQDLWRRLNAELEVGQLAVPEALGGHGYGVRELGVLLEETAAALVPEPFLASSVLGVQALVAAEDPGSVADLLTAASTGQRVVTLASLDSATPALAATRSGDGWTVSGSMPRVLQGAAADTVVVAAAGPDGPVLLAVETAAARVEPLTGIDLTRRLADIAVDAAPARLLVGPVDARPAIARLQLLSRAAVACEHAGIAAELLDRTREYVSEREQFGRPIGSFQAVKHRLADVLVAVERSRSAARYAAAELDGTSEGAELAVAVAAAVCTDAAVHAAQEAIQLHGGIGFTWEHRAHYYYRRVLGDEGLHGSASAARARVADLIGI
ncbi:acyl-CoA/acyl-ACP dehydrogenase [Nocardioides panacisoli]|uniref:acyl-CoA dehydrogenase family protein n=1 Tax=Nocardioides panacisoli TaxID=627624 RepID=UPI001C62ED41|nr:acyl-CoA dehydrogenase family protein [Nocardioides panacisoli]QYJ03572.1 acyl-CoA/acyl-ACP dehydrogenase [Nocardioides panacisoli]